MFPDTCHQPTSLDLSLSPETLLSGLKSTFARRDRMDSLSKFGFVDFYIMILLNIPGDIFIVEVLLQYHSTQCQKVYEIPLLNILFF